MNNFILEELEKASNLSERISDNADTAKRALAGLLTDKDRDDIYNDIDVLMDALEGIKFSANRIWFATVDAKRGFGKEAHNTTE